jgi:predicted esterase
MLGILDVGLPMAVALRFNGRFPATVSVLFVVVILRTDFAQAIDPAEAIKLSRAYLASDDKIARRQLAKDLDNYDGAIEPVLARLSARSFEPVKAGYHPAEHFSDSKLRIKHPDDRLYFTVPKSYRPDRATGLIVFMHGGGATTTRRAPRYFMNFPRAGVHEEDTFQLGNLFETAGMIAVGPSAPWDEETSYRWCIKKSDEYLADVIAECKTRFNIDPDRVFLMGHSMGGFGAYHHILRQPDRFAAVIVNSGSWKLGYWPAIRGTPLCIVQGVHDAAEGRRWHYTDINYARWTDKLLTSMDLDHKYFEHDGGHGMNYGKEYVARFLQSADHLRRDPYYPHITLASPAGFMRSFSFPVTDNRWLTLNESTQGKLTYDELRDNGTKKFDDWRLRHSTSDRSGSAIDAANRGHNTIVVSTRNVARFTIWLHPRMVDVNKSVRVIVNEKIRYDGNVKPSLLTALESYVRREDWGLIYPIKLEFNAD